MSTRKSIRPLLRLSTASPTIASSPALSQEFSDVKSDPLIISEDKADDMTDFAPSRPLSVAIPRTPFGAAGPYCPRRPNLSDILNNQSPQPWTLTAFMAYLSQNHCLETLEFTMDATRYRKHYNKMATRSAGGQMVPGTEECTYVQGLWQKLLEAYIVPNGPREVNIPSEVRDKLISQSNSDVPPQPAALDTAVQKVYDLMEESVLVPFLNSFYPQTANPDSAENTSTEDLPNSAYPGGHSYDERSMYRRSRRSQRSSPPLSQSIPVSAPPIPNRASAPSSFSQFARTFSHSARHISQSSSGSYSARPSSGAVLSPWTSSTSDSTGNSPADIPSAGALTDDTSVSSPSGELMTPPTTPPQCDYPAGSPSYSGSPLSGSYGSRKEPGAWKKVRSSFGFRKKSGGLREEEVDQAGNFI